MLKKIIEIISKYNLNEMEYSIKWWNTTEGLQMTQTLQSYH